jgi:Nif-specific ferredoxin III
MSVITGMTRGGIAWTPAFVMDLRQATCIGCGRCYKVCPRDVFELVDRDDLDLEDIDDGGDDDDDGFSDDTSMVMSLKNALDCIGCQACARVCPKKCLSHEPLAAAA